MNYGNKIARHFSKALKSEYIIDSGKLVFKHITKDSVHVHYDNELILGFRFNYMLNRPNATDIVSLMIENYENSKVVTSILEVLKNDEYDKVFEDGVRDMLIRLDLNIGKKTVVVNNAQEIIEITKKAKEENIKKDIKDIEFKILEAAKDGNERLLFSLSELKTDVSLMNKYDNEIINHFKNKGFECSICDGNHLGRYLKISWGD